MSRVKVVIKKIGITFFFIFILFIFLMPKIVLNGDSVQQIKLNGVYKEKGYSLYSIFNKKVKVTNNINTKKTGIYKVNYKMKFLWFDISKSIKVEVVDNVTPKISLIGDKTINLCPNMEYKEQGYKAIDNIDGDITDKVFISKEQLNLKNYRIKYIVMDSSNNKNIAYRFVNYIDLIPPTITLKGELETYIYINTEYKELGYNVIDNCGENINVELVGNVDVKKPGTYSIKYIAKDIANNETQITRNIHVIRKNKVRENGKNAIVYLTFDDGPNDSYTSKYLDILKEENVKATFFVTLKGSDSLLKRINDEGHSIGLHTASHQYEYIYSSVDNFFSDMKIVRDRVKNVTGVDSKIIRFAGGSSNTASKRYYSGIMTILTNEVLNRGYRYFDWNISSGDAGNTTSSKAIYNNVVNNLNLSKPNMILMHDVHPYSLNALRDIIKYAKANGYEFDKITYKTEMITHKVNN